jgi:hypothetical protein
LYGASSGTADAAVCCEDSRVTVALERDKRAMHMRRLQSFIDLSGRCNVSKPDCVRSGYAVTE